MVDPIYGKNQPVSDYLNRYCHKSNRCDVAVMLTGEWGSGKTHFIKRYIDSVELNEGIPEFMYVSLYGITSSSQIDDELFRQLHPFLSSKKVKFATQIFKGALRGAFKIDIGSNSTSLDLQVPPLNLQEYASKSMDRIEDRYPEIRFDQTFITIPQLTALLLDGRVNVESVRSEIDHQPPFSAPQSEPPWKRVARLFSATDAEISEAVDQLEAQFERREVTKPGETLHVFGLRLLLSEVGLITKAKGDLIEECKKYVDDLKEGGAIGDKYVEDEEDFERFMGYAGLQFASSETKEFAAIKRHYEDVMDQQARDNLPRHPQALMDLMAKDTTAFFRKLCLNNVERSPFYNVPILAYIAPKEFVDGVVKLPPDGQRQVFLALQSRYERASAESTLDEELGWLKKVNLHFKETSRTLGPLSSYRINAWIKKDIEPVLKRWPDRGTSV